MARSTVTAKQLWYDAKMLLGIRDSVLPNTTEGIRLLNYSIFTLSNLLDGLYDAWERKTSALTRNMNGTATGTVIDSTGNSYAYATKTITVTGTHGLGAAHLGGLCVMYDTSTDKGYAGIVYSTPTSTTFVLIDDPVGGNITTGNLAWTVIAFPWYTDGANIASLNIKRINAIKDATNGAVVPLNHNEFQAFGDNPNLASSVGSWDFGDGVHLKAGSSISTWGTNTMHYNADPTEITAMTDSVDLETEHHAMIVADVARQIEKAYPELGKRQNQDDPFGDLRKLYDSIDTAFIEKKFAIHTAGEK